MPESTKEIHKTSKNLEAYIKLKELNVIIHNNNDTLLFLKDDILSELEHTSQKKMATRLYISEPAFSLMIKFFKSLDALNYTSSITEFTVFYDTTSYTLYKEDTEDNEQW